MIDLFPWYPWIYFWSYLINILAKKENAQVKFFYFNLYDNPSPGVKLEPTRLPINHNFKSVDFNAL